MSAIELTGLAECWHSLHDLYGVHISRARQSDSESGFISSVSLNDSTMACKHVFFINTNSSLYGVPLGSIGRGWEGRARERHTRVQTDLSAKRGAREELGDEKLEKITFCTQVRLLLRFTCKIQTSSVINRKNKYRFKSLNLETQLWIKRYFVKVSNNFWSQKNVSLRVISLLNCDLHHLIVLSVIKEEMDQGKFHDDYNLGNWPELHY